MYNVQQHYTLVATKLQQHITIKSQNLCKIYNSKKPSRAILDMYLQLSSDTRLHFLKLQFVYASSNSSGQMVYVTYTDVKKKRLI